MTYDPRKPPRNRDQELPARKGDSIETPTPPEPGSGERKRNAPLSEEETYERESDDRRRNDQP